MILPKIENIYKSEMAFNLEETKKTKLILKYFRKVDMIVSQKCQLAHEFEYFS